MIRLLLTLILIARDDIIMLSKTYYLWFSYPAAGEIFSIFAGSPAGYALKLPVEASFTSESAFEAYLKA